MTPRLAEALADRYTIERELGAGGMAVVYLARDKKLDRDVALKVLRPELAAVLGAERFLNEIKISARLDHPHIFTLIDSGAAEGFLYYVLPFVRGESLRQRLTREKQLDIKDALTITRQVAGALDYAHRQGVVHRDIKPENILIQEGEAMLTDFGIALAVKEAGGNRLTETGLSLGTPQYMSPEQATGDRQLDGRSDIYSLGAVLYEMLTGEPPVTGPTVQAVIAKLLTERPTRVRVVRDTVPEGVDNAIAKALAKTPADRFSGAADFVHALDEGSPRTTVQRVSRPLAYALGVAGIAAIGGLGIWIGKAAFGGVHTVAVALRDRTQLTFTGRARRPAISGDGKQLAYVTSSCEASCTYSLEIQDVGGTASRSVLDGATSAYGMIWSPDRRNLLFGGSLAHHYGVYLLSTVGGAPRYVTSSGADFWAGGDSLIVSPPFHQDSVFWLRIEALNGTPGDSIRIAQRGLGVYTVTVPGSPLIVASVQQTATQDVAVVIDRAGRVLDRVVVPHGSIVRRSRDALWILASSDVGQPAPITRRSLDARSGRLSSRADTVYVGSESGYDVTADGGTLILDDGSYDFDVWSMGFQEALRGAFAPAHRVLSASSQVGGIISPDGGRLLVVRHPAVGLELRLAVMPVSGGAESPLPSLGHTEDFSWVDSVTVALAELVSGRVTFSLVDVRTGRRRATLQIGDSTFGGGHFGQFAALPSSTWAWLSNDGQAIRVQGPGDSAARVLTIPTWYKAIFSVVTTADGRGVAYLGWNTATYDTVRVSVVSLGDGSTTSWAQAFGEAAWCEVLADHSILFFVQETQEGVTLYRVRAPGKMERLGSMSRDVNFFNVSTDLRRATVSTFQYHADVFMSRVVRQ